MYVALKSLSELRPAEDYEDQGVRSFEPYAVYPVQAPNTGASGRDRRMNPNKTVYMVCYRATDGSGCKWSDEALTRDLGEEIVEAGETVRRRVLSIPSDGTYITVGPDQTAGSYAESLRGRYTRIVGLSTLYILFYFIVLVLVKLVRRLRKDRAEGKEPERASAPRDASNVSRFDPEIKESRRFHHAENRSGWRQEPEGIEVRKPPRIPFMMKLSLLILAAAFLLFAFQRLGSSDPVDLDYGWSGNTWTCEELELRFDLPAGGVIFDAGEQQKEREKKFGRRGSAWRTWRIELPGQGRTYWYLYRQEGEYALSVTSSGPTAGMPPAILACFRGENSLVPVNQYLLPLPRNSTGRARRIIIPGAFGFCRRCSASILVTLSSGSLMSRSMKTGSPGVWVSESTRPRMQVEAPSPTSSPSLYP